MLIAEKTVKLKVSKTRRRHPSVRLVAFSQESLRRLRKEFKVNQKELAEYLEVEQGQISHLETGRAKPDFGRMKQFGAFFSKKAGYKIVFYADHEESDEKAPPDYWGEA